MSDSAEEASNFHRIISLVMDIGTETLRDLFYKGVPRGVVQTLFSTPDIESEFKRLKSKGVLKQPQLDKLTNNPNPDLYDISLLVILLQNKKICTMLPAPVNGWYQDPPDSDHNVGADLLRLREIRNRIVAHRENARLQTSEFQSLWCQIRDILIRIANYVGPSEERKIAQLIKDAESQKVVQDTEKKLITFVDWYKQDSEKYQQQLEIVQNSLASLHIKVDGISQPSDTTDTSKESILSSVHSQISSLTDSYTSIAQQESVMEIKRTVYSMGGTMNNILKALNQMRKMFDESQKSLQQLSQQAHRSDRPNAQSGRTDFDHPDAVRAPTPLKKPKIDNPNAMSEREILDLSKQIGFEWEALRIHLDLTEAQSHALTQAFGLSVQERIYKMLKAWHDVVVECGENPKMLLAAAFVNASQNYAMAYKIVPRNQFNKNACARQQTVDRIQSIEFRKDGFRTGDGDDWSYGRTTTSSQPRHGALNIFGGDVEFCGNLSLPCSTAPSSVTHDGSPYGYGAVYPQGAVNVHGGRVKFTPTSNIVLGPPGAQYAAPFTTGYSEPFFRGELQDKPGNSWMSQSSSTLPSSGPPSSCLLSSWGSSGQPFKKEHDNTLSQSMIAALHEQMKSVGVLLYGSNLRGTVFRVGTKYVMTAFHVIQSIIDPNNTGVYDSSRLEDTHTCIHFNESTVISAVNPMVKFYHVKRNFIFNKDLDIAVLEIADPRELPRRMFLSKEEFSGSDISLVGYGNPKNPYRKYLDPKCKIIKPDSQRIRSVMAWLQQNRMTFKGALYEWGQKPETVDLGYHGFDNPTKLLFDCYMEHGASGAPVLTNDNERSVHVVGMLTHGLPDFYFRLPESIQRTVPHQCRIEQGATMKYVYEWMNRDHPEITNDLFG